MGVLTGTLLNAATVLIGGVVGAVVGDRLPERLRENVVRGVGLFVTAMGLKFAIETTNLLFMLGAMLLGGIVGSLIGVDALLNRLGETLQRRFASGAKSTVAEAFVTVTSASRALTELCISDAAALDVLADLDRPVTFDIEDVDALRRWKRLGLLRIAARDLLGIDDLEVVGQNLAALADDALRTACRLANTSGLAIIGMGKLGGNELNYASDVDVLFVAIDAETGERQARAIMDIARSCFRVDTDLRPEGRDGPLARSLESYMTYWERWADTWEFQALLKARAVTGDPELGAAFIAAAGERVWGQACVFLFFSYNLHKSLC